MLYSANEVMDYVKEDDVKFIRLAFCDVSGKQKNISILPTELPRAFEDGIGFDASAVYGFGGEVTSDLFLLPDPSTLQVFPWRPSHGRVVRMYCDIRNPDGTDFELDSRMQLKKAVKYAKDMGISCNFGAEFEFYLFKTNETGEPTKEPSDRAGYMDIAPDDKGENVRREICLTLEEMGLTPESSHHEEGPGQHEIDFRYSDPLTAADNATTFKAVVKTIADRNGLYAEFSPKPISGEAGSGMHINMSVESSDGTDYTGAFIAGIMDRICDITAILNPTGESYARLGEKKAPRYVSWSPENRSQLIRIPAAKGLYRRIELRSPDAQTNPYLAYALLIYAGLDGIERGLSLCEPANINLYTAGSDVTKKFVCLPKTIHEARRLALESSFLREKLPSGFVRALTCL